MGKATYVGELTQRPALGDPIEEAKKTAWMREGAEKERKRIVKLIKHALKCPENLDNCCLPEKEICKVCCWAKYITATVEATP